MQKDELYSPDSINIENLKALSGEQSVLFEKRISELYELSLQASEVALELSSAGLGIYEILGFISDGLRLDAPSPHSYALEANASRLKSHLSSLSAHDKAVFAMLFTDGLKKREIKASESDFLSGGEGDGRVIYVKNRLSDEAYDVFSDSLSEATVAYTESLRNAALAVADGKAEYCILPLEEKGGARLASIAALLFNFDLKIASVTPVFGFDGSADVKYALVSKHFSIPDVAPDDDRYLEIRLRADGALSLTALFSAADMLGASVYRINTVKFESEDGENTFYTIVFKDEGRDFSELLVYLTMFAGSYTALGIYKNLE